MAERADARRADIDKRRASARGRNRQSGATRGAGKKDAGDGTARVKTGRGGRGPSGEGSGGGLFSRVSPRALMLLALLAVFAVLSFSPVARNLEATTRAGNRESELKKERALTESLEKEVAEACSLEYVEKEARKQRLVAPGEILILVTTDGPENEVTYRVKALQSMEEAWARVRRMLHSIPRSQ